MATTMVGQRCKLVKLISGIRNLKLSLARQPEISGLSKSIWTGSIFDAGSKETAQVSRSIPSKPKMPANVFVLFLMKVAEDIKKNHPDIKRPELVREASKMWQDLDPEEKSRLTLERRDHYEKYKEDMRVYLDNMTPEQIQAEDLKKEKKAAKRLKSLRKQLGMPKKPLGSFSYFVSEKFPEHPGIHVSTVFRQLIDQWAMMSDAEKEKYKQKAIEYKQQYEEDIAKWEKEMIALGRFDVVRKSLITKLNKASQSRPVKKKKTVGFSAYEDDSEL